MSAFDKLLEKRPDAIVGYTIGRAKAQRTEWMEMARKTKFPELRADHIRVARERNRELIRALKTL